jgi:hypothetical protein
VAEPSPELAAENARADLEDFVNAGVRRFQESQASTLELVEAVRLSLEGLHPEDLSEVETTEFLETIFATTTALKGLSERVLTYRAMYQGVEEVLHDADGETFQIFREGLYW